MRAVLLISTIWVSASAEAGSLRQELLAIPISENLGGATTRPVATIDAFTFVAANASPANRAQFSFGNQMFTVEWKPTPGPQPVTDGLGPVFNRESCFACHDQNGRGRAPDGPSQPMTSMLMRLSVPGADAHGGPKPVPKYGDQLQDRAVEGVPAEGRAQVTWSEITGKYADGERYVLRKPSFTFTDLAFGALPERTMASPRVANPVIGLGLLEAVPVATLEALADPADADQDGISGRMNVVWDAASQSMKPGRFGWKANVASLDHQNAGAARGDMGITTPVFTAENCEPEQTACAAAAAESPPEMEMSGPFFQRLRIYMQLLAVPKQRGADWPEVRKGEKLFRDIGCAACHLPTLKTDASAGLAELRDQTFHPFTDLLLHDMGEGLSDGRPDYLAHGAEWRTPPLWGLGLTESVSGHTFFLHDGRARNVAEAILWHGGEAAAAKEKFRSLPKARRAELLAFLGSL
ncbi:MAG: di-heme oxidoredictase family protein [Rhodospirillaceae bacterium]|nr:di-heme oxidoredictase family protein [Rhodospirillaceae bacterium]